MSTLITDMYDATHANIDKIPLYAVKVLGYSTGTPSIKWTEADKDRFKHAGIIMLDQGFGTTEETQRASDGFDVEPGAWSISDFAKVTHRRVTEWGIRETILYCDRNDAPTAIPALKAVAPGGWYFGHVVLVLAWPGATIADVNKLLDHQYEGITCKAVQDRDDGTFDISHAVADWHPAPVTTPPPPPRNHLMSVVLTGHYSDGTVKTATM